MNNDFQICASMMATYAADGSPDKSKFFNMVTWTYCNSHRTTVQLAFGRTSRIVKKSLQDSAMTLIIGRQISMTPMEISGALKMVQYKKL